MRLPGTNTLTLTHEAIGALVEATLNEGREPDASVRVTKVRQKNSYSDELEFDITTDLPESEPLVFHANPAPQPAPQPEPLPMPSPAPVLLPTAPDDRPF